MHDARFPLLGIFVLLLTLAIGGAALATLSDGNLIYISAVLLIAFAKARFVILDFMELRHGQRSMALSLLAWSTLLLLVALARPLLVSYLA